MANSNDWGKVYCFTEWGEEFNTIRESIRSFSAPSCFTTAISGTQVDTLALTIDDTIKINVSSTKIKIDQTVI